MSFNNVNSVKSCVVPSCNSTSLNGPKKKFYQLPNDPKFRRLWLQRANIHLLIVPSQATCYFCGDHFDGASSLIPSKFECQYFAEFDLLKPEPPLQVSYVQKIIKIRAYKSHTKPSRREILMEQFLAQNDPNLYTLKMPTINPKSKKFAAAKKNNNLALAEMCLLIALEHSYVKKIKGLKASKYSNEKNHSSETTKLNDNFFRHETNKSNFEAFQSEINKKKAVHFSLNEQSPTNSINSEHFNESTDSAESVQTFKCQLCELEYIHHTNLQIHMNSHFNIENGVGQNIDEDYGEQSHLDFDENLRQYSENFGEGIEQDATNFQEEPMQYDYDVDERLDIKPEIFQCSKCPSSFINEEDMSKHLQIMHADLADITRHIKTLKNNKQDTEKCANSNNTLNNNDQCVEITEKGSKERSNSEINFADYNFAEIETSVEIKRECEDVEDINFSIDNNQHFDEQNLGLDPMFNLFENNLNYIANIDTATELNQNESNIQEEQFGYQITENSSGITTFKCSFQDTISRNALHQQSINDPIQQNSNSDLIRCKKCLLTFSSEEKLLNHLHELINTKAKLYSDAKRVLKVDSVRFKSVETISRSGEKQYLTEAELLEHIHKVFDKTKKNNLLLQVVKYITEDDNDSLKRQNNDTVDQTKCRCCSKRLSKATIACKRKDKICRRCKIIETKKKKRQRHIKAQLYASAKNEQLKNCADAEKACDKALSNTFKHNKTNIAKLNEVLGDVSDFLSKEVEEKTESESDDDITSFVEGDLLKPIREEDEKVLVQPYDPNLCKSCLVRLDAETIGNKDTICEKCETLEASNEKRRKSNEKRISVENKGIPRVLLHRLPEKYDDDKYCKINSSKNRYGCQICHLKFDTKLGLRQHVERSHL